MRFLEHFPTFAAALSWWREWYAGRDLFERLLITASLTIGALYIVFLIFFSAPTTFPAGAYVKVPQGSSLKSIAADFEDRQIVRSGLLLEALTRVLGNPHKIPAGEYFFPNGEDTLSVAIRLITGNYETAAIKVTIPEGSTVQDIARILYEKVPDFDPKGFMDNAREGYMFPDTYYIMPGESTESILAIFGNNFRVRTAKIQNEILAFGKPLEEVVIMASLLEKEAAKTQDRRMIAGVLWERIRRGMPLQVDAAFRYVNGKHSFTLTREDLAEDHPYNTYTRKGLPAGPIGNPGLDAILAAVTPIKTNYLYFLSDLDGNFHFSTTYAQHLRYKNQYLD